MPHSQSRGAKLQKAPHQPEIATSRILSQRDLTFGSQRFIPKPRVACHEPATCHDQTWFYEDHHDLARSNSNLSHAPSTAQSNQGKMSAGERAGLLSRLRGSNRSSGESLLPSTRDVASPELKRRSSRRRFFEAVRNLRPRQNTKEPLQRFVYEIPTQSWEGEPSPTDYHLPAPAPTFGDIPGVGYEKQAPHIDLSSGAAARAAAAAQKALTNNMKRLDIKAERVVIRDSESGIGVERAENEPSLTAQGIRKGERYPLTELDHGLSLMLDPIVTLPSELVSLIFSYLEPHAILKCESVSRSWRGATLTQYNWRRLFLSEYKAPHHREFTSERRSDDDAYPEVHWKSRWKALMMLSQRWSIGDASAFYMEGHSDNIYCVQFDDEKIVTGSKDRTIRVWSTRMAQCVRILGAPIRQFSSAEMECLPEMAKPTPRQVHHAPIFASLTPTVLPFYHSGSILCLQYDHQIMVTGSSDSSIIIWQKESMFDFRPLRRLSRHSKGVLDVSFDNDHIVSCSKDHTICVWSRADGSHLRTIEGHRGPVNAVRLKGELIVSASGDTVVRLWNVRSGDCIKEFSRSSRGLACVEISLDLHKIWAGGNDHDIYEFDTEDGSLVRKMGSHADLVRSLHLDSNSGRLVSASYDSTIKIFNTFDDSQSPISLRDWSASWILGAKADYRRIVATSQDRRVIIVDFGHGIENIESLDPGSYGLPVLEAGRAI